MNFRNYLILMTLATLIAWITWSVVLHSIDPTRSGLLGFLLFYLTLGMMLFGTISVLGMLIRLWRSREELVSRIAIRSLRHGFLLTTLFMTSLLLFSQGWFRWWTMVLIVIIVSMTELLFLARSRPF